MKKTLLTVLLATASAITFADGSFTGAGLEVGAEWEQTRYKKDDLKVHNNSYMATVGYRFK